MNKSAIFSMTGFGSGTASRNKVSAEVEIRSVNHRGMKLNVRSRPPLGPLEKELRDIVLAKLARGSVDVFVTLKRELDDEHPPVREDVARAAVSALRKLGSELGLSGEVTVSDLIGVPGLFDLGSEGSITPEEWPVVEEATVAAVTQAVGMRQAEGEATAEKLAELLLPIENFSKEARAFAPKVVERTRERIKARLEELCPGGLQQADSQALEREVCLFADRADINEEMDRLESHLSQFRGMLKSGGEIGKRLEFIAQEFLREINTTASKANDTEIVKLAVDAKLAVEKIKEQAANIE